VVVISKAVGFPKESFSFRDIEAHRISGIIYASIVTVTKIHIGSGREVVEKVKEVGVDNKTIQNLLASDNIKKVEAFVIDTLTAYFENVLYGNLICVPGSTVKGLLRSRLELIPAQNGIAFGCMRTSFEPFTQLPPEGVHGWRHARIWRESVMEAREPSCNPLEVGDYSLCKICDLFGAPGVIGRVYLSNFCCSVCEERVELPYGEKVVAIKPGVELVGSVSFSGLSLDELGIVFISMGLTENSTEGKHILIGKHKYAYRDMGVAKFVIKRFEAPKRFLNELKSMDIQCELKEYRVVCEGLELRKLMSRAINSALNRYPQLGWLYSFSEVDRRSEVVR